MFPPPAVLSFPAGAWRRGIDTHQQARAGLCLWLSPPVSPRDAERPLPDAPPPPRYSHHVHPMCLPACVRLRGVSAPRTLISHISVLASSSHATNCPRNGWPKARRAASVRSTSTPLPAALPIAAPPRLCAVRSSGEAHCRKVRAFPGFTTLAMRSNQGPMAVSAMISR